MNMTNQRNRSLAGLAILAIVSLFLAACGSSSSTSTSSSGAAASASGASGAGGAGGAGGPANRAKLTACLKQHGVTLPNRPPGGGYGPPPGAGNGGGPPAGGGGSGGRAGRFNNPKFRAAIQACGGRAGFGGGQGGFHLSSATITKFASCVKQHGYTLPKANLTGKGSVYPVSVERNAKFQSASRACQSILRPAGGGGPPASGAAAGA
jgi:hypothetical protein